jgi:hypothetical protein
MTQTTPPTAERQATQAAKAQYAVIYRTGGSANFKWRRVLDVYATRAQAEAKADEIEHMGYTALVHDAARLDAIGMPDTYSAAVSR